MDSMLWLSAAVGALPGDAALRLIDATKRHHDAREQTRRAKDVTRAYFRRLTREGVALDPTGAKFSPPDFRPRFRIAKAHA